MILQFKVMEADTSFQFFIVSIICSNSNGSIPSRLAVALKKFLLKSPL